MYQEFTEGHSFSHITNRDADGVNHVTGLTAGEYCSPLQRGRSSCCAPSRNVLRQLYDIWRAVLYCIVLHVPVINAYSYPPCASVSLSVVMADVSLHQLFAKVREVDDFAAVLRTLMEDVASKVDFSHVKSCVAMGAHHGEREIDFTRRLLHAEPEVVRRRRAGPGGGRGSAGEPPEGRPSGRGNIRGGNLGAKLVRT